MFEIGLKVNRSHLLITFIGFPQLMALMPNINHDLEKISVCAFYWRMRFNSDPTKQALEKIFKRNCFILTHLFI